MTKLNYMNCWNRAMEILAQHKEAILALSGVFLFLPTLLTAQFVGEPVLNGTEEADALFAAYSLHFSENWFSIMLSNLLISFGGLAIYFAIAPSQKGTVAENLSKAGRFFLFFLIANILTGLATALGFLALIIPGLYIACRLVLVPMIIADQEEGNPINALTKSWEATKNNGFSILLFILMVGLIGIISIGVLQMLVGVVIGLASGGEGWKLLENLVAALAGTAFQIVLTVLIAAMYEQLTGKEPDVSAVFS